MEYSSDMVKDRAVGMIILLVPLEDFLSRP